MRIIVPHGKKAPPISVRQPKQVVTLTNIPRPQHLMEAHVIPDKMGQQQQSTLAKPWQVWVYVDDYTLAGLSTVGVGFIRRIA
jgi:hypothetical protein